MGNSKSKKMKITQNEGQKSEESRERINSIKTDTADINVNKKSSADVGTEPNEERNNDNASSASTVEVLDDK